MILTLWEERMIRGIAWDHRRCWGPLEASIAPYRALTGEEVVWERRSLYSFGEGDLGDYAARYDLVIYDHPFVGDVCRRGWLRDLAQEISVEERGTYTADSVGQSWPSYEYDGGIWALPIDSAAQTAAWRPDLMESHGLAIPTTLAEVRELAVRLKKHGLYVGWPFVPTDLMCTLVSLAASRGLTPGQNGEDFLARDHASEVIADLRDLAGLVHPLSRTWNPIACLNHMANQNDVAYAPYLFNYVNYSTSGMGHHIRFGQPPKVSANHRARTLLGGAGIGVSAKAANPAAAIAYAKWLCSPSYQGGDYVKFGGQPGSRSAWQSPACNALTGSFFANTLPALDAAFLRPTHPGFVPFFHDATLRLTEVILNGASEADFVSWLNAAYDTLRQKAARP